MEIRKGNADEDSLLLAIRERIRSQLRGSPAAAADRPAISSATLQLNELRGLCTAAGQSFAAIGRLPVSPPTLRGRAGRLVIRVLQRMLDWYTSQIVCFNGLLAGVARAQLAVLQTFQEKLEAGIPARLEALEQRLDKEMLKRLQAWEERLETEAAARRQMQPELGQLRSEITRLGRQAESQAESIPARLEALEQRLDKEMLKRLQAWEERLETEAAARRQMQPELGQLRSEITRLGRQAESQAESIHHATAAYTQLRSELVGLREYVDDNLRRSQGTGLDDRFAALERKLAHVGTEVVMQSRRLSVLLAEVRTRLETLRPAQVAALAADSGHHIDGVYVAFEDLFRGTREDIKDRLRVYLPWLKAAGDCRTPVLDLGCGRGEWLQLLGEEKFEASGVDSNRMMAEQCRQHGLNVTESDAVTYLRGLPEASVGVVTAFHVLEHLPLDALMAVLDETVRVLKPGGLAIFETPNPANLLVGAYSFYTDPTHRNPLPSPTLAFLAEARGLCEIQALALNPPAPGLALKEDGSETVRWLNQHFYGPQDYAVIGKKL